MNKNDILERQTAIRSEMAELAAGDEFTSDQAQRFNELQGEFSDLDSKRQVIERADEARGKVDLDVARVAPRESTAEEFERDPLGHPDDVQRVSTLDNPWDLDQIRANDRNAEELVSRALSAAEQTPGPGGRRREALTRLIERGSADTAKLVLATTSPNYKAAYGKIVRAGGDIARARLTDAEYAAMDYAEDIKRGVSTTDNAGGYLIPTDIEPVVTLSSDGTNNPLWNLARREQTTSDTYRVVTAPHATWSWDGELTEVSDDQPTFANVDIPLYFAQGFMPVSIAANQSIENITATVSRTLSGGYADLVGAALTTGSGSSQPTGIVTALTGGSSEVASASTDTFAVADVYALYEPLPARHRRNATWVSNVAAMADIRQFATDDGQALIARLGEGDPQRLLGRPWVENEDMDSSITATSDNYYLLFGDFQHFVIAEGIGMLTRVIPDVFGANGRPIGATGFYAATRFGSDSVLDGAFRMLNVT